MATGPGKYDDACTAARRDTDAQGVVLIVLGGKHGNGFSVQATAEITFALPGLLREVATDIEQSRFLIWSEEHGAWWRPGRAGYTTSIREAGRYMRDEAAEIVVLANRGVETGFNEVAVPDPLVTWRDAVRAADKPGSEVMVT